MRILLDDGGGDVTEEMLHREAVRRVAAEPIDVVLVDLHLPDITGLDVCKALRAIPKTAKMPILLISAESEQEETSRLAEQHGADGFLPDTVEPAALLEAVRSAIDRAAHQ
jgi:CheY-like chemotaxis protein